MFERADEEPLEQETRIWCPMCNKCSLIKCSEPTTRRTGFRCPGCWQIAAHPLPQLWEGLHSPRSILNRQLASFSTFYWPAINDGKVHDLMCGHLCGVRILTSQQRLEALDSTYGDHSPHGVFIQCDFCPYEEVNYLPHLTIDLLEAQQFWRRHTRVLWLPEREIDYAGPQWVPERWRLRPARCGLLAGDAEDPRYPRNNWLDQEISPIFHSIDGTSRHRLFPSLCVSFATKEEVLSC